MSEVPLHSKHPVIAPNARKCCVSFCPVWCVCCKGSFNLPAEASPTVPHAPAPHCVKSLRSSYTGLYPQSDVTQSRPVILHGFVSPENSQTDCPPRPGVRGSYGGPHALLSPTMNELIGFRKSTLPQNHQLIVLISNG